MSMALIDVLMVGPLGPQAIAGCGLGSAIFGTFHVFAYGLLFGMDPLISQAFGAKRLDECRRWFAQGFYLCLMASIPLTLGCLFVAHRLTDIGAVPEVAVAAESFLATLSWCLPTLFMFFVFRLYLQAMDHVRFVTVLMIFGNFSNVLFDWLFIYGHWGFSAMGVRGSAMATNLTRALIDLALLAYLLYHWRSFGWHNESPHWKKLFYPDLKRIKRLLRLGVPAGLQTLFEMGVFSLSTAIASHISAVAGAAHSIALNIASLTFMVPLGIGSATSVRVGQFLGEQRPKESRAVGWLGILCAGTFMACSGVLLFSFRHTIVGFFSRDPQVIDLGAHVLIVAAIFQIVDGLQTSATGALRGLGDTHSAMVANFVGHWVVGLPIGLLFAFKWLYGVVGLWSGLATGLAVVAGIVVFRWQKLSNAASSSSLT